MHDAVQPGSSSGQVGMSMTGLEASLPHVPSQDGLIALFKKRGAEAVRHEDEEKERSRKAKFLTNVGQPPSSAAVTQDRRKRRAPVDGANPSSKRRRGGRVPTSQVFGKAAIATPTTESGRRTEDPKVAMEENLSAPEFINSEAPVFSQPDKFDWADIRNPRNPFLCIIQANDAALIGSFDKNERNWAFQLTLDAGRPDVGRRCSPDMTMEIFSKGIHGPQCGQTEWCLADYIRNDWMVLDLKIHHLADCAEGDGIRHRDVVAACKTKEERARLVCISLEAWPKILGHFNMGEKPQPGVEELFSAVFTGRHPYQLRIWFIAPYKVEKFEKQCLSAYKRCFEQRQLPLTNA